MYTCWLARYDPREIDQLPCWLLLSSVNLSMPSASLPPPLYNPAKSHQLASQAFLLPTVHIYKLMVKRERHYLPKIICMDAWEFFNQKTNQTRLIACILKKRLINYVWTALLHLPSWTTFCLLSFCISQKTRLTSSRAPQVSPSFLLLARLGAWLRRLLYY